MQRIGIEVRRGGVEPGDHVGAGRAGGADADADIAGLGARIAVGHVRSALDMARQDMADRASLAQRRVERIDRGAWHAESDRHALPLEHQHRRVHRLHLGHRLLRPFVWSQPSITNSGLDGTLSMMWKTLTKVVPNSDLWVVRPHNDAKTDTFPVS